MTMRQRKRALMARAHEAMFPRSLRGGPFYVWNGLSLVRVDDFLGLRPGSVATTDRINLRFASEMGMTR